MNKPTLYIIGAGEHGRVVLDLARATQAFADCVFLDDDSSLWKRKVDDAWALPRTELPGPAIGVAVTVAIGLNNGLRAELTRELLDQGHALPALVHPSAWISSRASVGKGAVVMAKACVQCGARVGQAAIVNTGALVDHDCEVGEGVHVSPGACLCGCVRVGRLAWIGAGATVIQGASVGEESVIGAGAAVVNDIGAGVMALGVPARVRPRGEKG